MLALVPILFGAKGKDIGQREEGLLKDIQVIESILKDNTDKSNTISGEIAHLEYQVLAARKIIYMIDDEVEVSNMELQLLKEQLAILDAEKKEAVIQCHSILLEEYKNRDYRQKLYFLASSKNISQFVNRLNHLNTLKDVRIRHLRAIDNKKREVEDKLAVYSGSKAEKDEISKTKTIYITELNEILRLKHQLNKKLEQENQTLQLRLKENNNYLAELNNEVEKTVKNISATETKSTLEDLPWPIKSGLVVKHFGVHKHEKERKVRVSNNGIDILVAPSEMVRSVAAGKVKAIVDLPGQNTTLIMDHGSFYSVYSNIRDVKLQMGSEVMSGEAFAKVARNKGNLSKLHFELWKGTEKVDPEKYLSGMLK